MKVMKMAGVIVLAVTILAGCAEAMQPAECIIEDNDGFLDGLLHGFIAPFTFIISLFDDEVAIYSLCNNGGWYDFGFLFGISIILGASGRSTK